MATGIKKAPADQWMTVTDAARVLEKSRHGVLVHIASGELDSQVVAGSVFVLRDSVEKLRRQLQKAS